MAFVSEIHDKLKQMMANQPPLRPESDESMSACKNQASVVYDVASGLPMYERNLAWEFSRAMKIAQERLNSELNQPQFPFKPEIGRL
jgi:ATP adenylyltransferase/5',5'''-P-1,P-4-tetraphosphate phosphorylase II